MPVATVPGPGRLKQKPDGFVTFRAPELGLRFRVRLGAGAPTVQLSTGWAVVARPRRLGLTDWQGRDPLRVAFPILFDNLRDGRGGPVEADIRRLERMAGAGGGNDEPPTVTVESGGAIPWEDLGNRRRPFVIESLTFGDSIRDARGDRVRQEAEVVLLQFVDSDTIEVSPARRRKGRGKGERGERFIRTRKGDTPRKVAARELGDRAKWKRIRDLNPAIKGARDPNYEFKVGTRLRIRAGGDTADTRGGA